MSVPKKIWRTLHCGLLFLATIALLGAGDPASRFDEIGHQLMCICGCNQILLECNHVGCPDSDGMRNELMAAVTRGDSDSLVEQAFVQKYGPTVLAAPPTTGAVNRAAWIVPFLALFVGFAVVGLVVRGWRKGPPAPPSSGSRSSTAALEQFREQARKETDL
jgi:cytochrome c-type biogenesis protein CcmH